MIIAIGMLPMIAGCGSGGVSRSGSAANANPNVKAVSAGALREFPVRPLKNRRTNQKAGLPDAFLPLRKNGKPHLIVGTVRFGRAYNEKLAAVDMSGNQHWQLNADYTTNNPRPDSGKAEKENWELLLDNGSVVGDVDRDGVEDICSWKGSARANRLVIVSGATGGVIVQSKVDDKEMQLTAPYSTYDQDGDSVLDLNFLSYDRQLKGLRIVTLSGTDLSVVRDSRVENHDGMGTLALADLTDETGDGIAEFMIQTVSSDRQPYYLSVVDGKKLNIIRDIPASPLDKSISGRFYLSMGDVNADGKGDYVICKDQGAKSNKNNGFMACCSGADGAAIWDIESEVFGGHVVDIQDRGVDGAIVVEKQLMNSLGKSGTVIPDQNNDGLLDIAILLTMDNMLPQRQRSLFVISGADGNVLNSRDLKTTPNGFSLTCLSNPGDSGKTILVTSGSKSNGDTMLILLEL